MGFLLRSTDCHFPNEPNYHTTTLVKLHIIKDHSIVALEKPAELTTQQIQKEIYSKQVNA